MTCTAEPAWGNTVDVDFSDDDKQSSKQVGKSRGAE